MTTEDYKKNIRAYIFEHFPSVRRKPLLDDDLLLESGIIDSLGVLDLVTYLEKYFKITITEEELLPDNFQSISCLNGFVLRKIGDAAATDSGE